MRRDIAICITLVVITLTAYWQAWMPGLFPHHAAVIPPPGSPIQPPSEQTGDGRLAATMQKKALEFVYFDDPGYITDNLHVKQGLTPESIHWTFNVGEQSNWHPLAWLSHLCDVQVCKWIGGSPTDSSLHHIPNIFLHIANSLLFFVLLKWITGTTWPSAMVAALFAVHPMHVESVAWVAERKDVLSTLIGLITIAAYVRYTRTLPAEQPYPLSNAATIVVGPLVAPLFGLLFGLAFNAYGATLWLKAYSDGIMPAMGTLFGAQGLLAAPAGLVFGYPFGVRFSLLAFFFAAVGLLLGPMLVLWKHMSVSEDRDEGFRYAFDTLKIGARYTLVVFLMATCLMAKPMLVTLPCLMLLLDFWPLRRMPKLFGSPRAVPRPAPELKAQKRTNRRRLPQAPRLQSPPSAAPGPRRLSGDAIRTALWLFVEKLPLFALAIASSVITWKAQAIGGSVAPVTHLPWSIRIQNVLNSYANYIGMLFWPKNMAAFYPLIPEDLNPLTAWAAAFLLLLITAGVIWGTWRGRRYLAMGWLWFMGLLVPVIGFAQVGDQSMADRYTYLSYIGLFVILVWGTVELLRRWFYARVALTVAALVVVIACVGLTYSTSTEPDESSQVVPGVTAVEPAAAKPDVPEAAKGQTSDKFDTPEGRIEWFKVALVGLLAIAVCGAAEAFSFWSTGRVGAAGACAVIIAGCVVVTMHQVTYWHDTTLLLQHCIDVVPKNHTACNNLGVKWWELGDRKKAMKYWRRAIELRPGYADAHSNLGYALKEEGNLNEAARHFLMAIQCNPLLAKAYNNLGLVLLQLNRVPEAQAQFEEAIRRRPEEIVARENLARVFLSQHKLDKAVEQLEAILRLMPGNPTATNSLVMWLVELGRLDEAARFCHVAIAADENNSDARHNLGVVLLRQGKPHEAVDEWHESLRRNGNCLPTLTQLAFLLAACPDDSVRDGPQAVKLAEHAAQLTGGKDFRVLDTLAAAYAETGQFAKAADVAQQALFLATEQKDVPPVLLDGIRGRMDIYRSGSPFHDQTLLHMPGLEKK